MNAYEAWGALVQLLGFTGSMDDHYMGCYSSMAEAARDSAPDDVWRANEIDPDTHDWVKEAEEMWKDGWCFIASNTYGVHVFAP
jgi:hypothetical protein